MARADEPTVIKKYANRRLYNTGTSTYVTLDDVAAMVRGGEDFVVLDARGGEDITHQVLTQIVLETESRSHRLLPAGVLRRLIALGGDGLEAVVPRFLERAVGRLDAEIGAFRRDLEAELGPGATPAGLDEHLRQHPEVIDGWLARLFDAGLAPQKARAHSPEFELLKTEIEAMRQRLDQLAPEGRTGPDPQKA
jgi:polyhydroxyalkanoate synthesis repressor PhaR